MWHISEILQRLIMAFVRVILWGIHLDLADHEG